MKKIILLLFLTVSCVYSQSPYYSISLSMADNENSYKITLQTRSFDYDPVVSSGDYWFGKDTSKLNWDNLPDSMYGLIKETKVNVQNGNQYKESNQAMIWERIYKFTIVQNNTDTMTIVFPILIKSFVTFIKLENIPFTKGYFELTHDIYYSSDDHLHATLPQTYLWKPTGYDERKIRIN